ncbi:MAG: hypothetical protein NTW03_10860 [Verrucomicrobia bacterium]|nr:hypothetical protein [Verrucomicrobiota bacterium]
MVGCAHVGNERAVARITTQPALAVARLLNVESTQLPLESHIRAGYAIETYLAGSARLTNCPGCVILEFYATTTAGDLPTNALLVLVPADAEDCSYLRRTYDRLIPADLQSSRYLNLNLLGEDASRSLLPDTQPNRQSLKQAVATGRIYPPRNQWLPKEAAIRLALVALLSSEPDYKVKTTAKATRSAFGWTIEWLPPSWKGIGSPAKVVVRDDGTVVYLTYALW